MNELTWFDKLMSFIFEGRFWCKIGFHTWTWKLVEDEVIYLNGKIPDRAKCKYCGKGFKDDD